MMYVKALHSARHRILVIVNVEMVNPAHLPGLA